MDHPPGLRIGAGWAREIRRCIHGSSMFLLRARYHDHGTMPPQKNTISKKKKMIHGHWTKLKETGKQNREIIFFPISKPQSSTSPQWTSWTMGYHGARPGPHFGVQKLRRVTRAEVAVQTVSPIAWATYACPRAIENRQSVFLI